MKITDVEAVRLLVPLEREFKIGFIHMTDRTVIVVKVHTDEGIIGLGDAYHSHLQRPESIAVIVETVLKPALVGEDPLQIEALWLKMSKAIRHLGSGGQGAMSGVDIALWDILGKTSGIPVYQLLGGGSVVPPIRPYVGSQTLAWRDLDNMGDLVEEAELYVRQGFDALKLRGGRGLPGRQEDVAAFRAIREAFGDEIKVMVDVNNGYSYAGAERMAPEYERYNIFWMEDPIDVSAERAPEWYAALAASIAVPIAVGGNLFGTQPLRKLISAGGVDIVMMDASSSGGISELVKMTHIAGAWNMKWAPVTHEPLGQLATLNVMAAASPQLTAGMYVEWDPGWPLDKFLSNPPRFEDGAIALPDGPGLGTDLKEEFVLEFSVAHF